MEGGEVGMSQARLLELFKKPFGCLPDPRLLERKSLGKDNTARNTEKDPGSCSQMSGV